MTKEEYSNEELEELTDEEIKEIKIKEEEKLDNMMNTFFKNHNSNVPAVDNAPVDAPLISNDLPKEQVDKEEEPLGIVQEEEDEEEIYQVHQDGTITGEITEAEDSIQYAKPEQSSLDKAIANKSIKKANDEIMDFYEEIDLLLDIHTENKPLLKSVLGPIISDVKRSVFDLKDSLSESGYSDFASIPNKEVEIEDIKDESLKKLVTQHQDELINKILDGGIE